MNEGEIQFRDNMLGQILTNQLSMLKAMCKTEDGELYLCIVETGIILKVLKDERVQKDAT